MDIYLEACTYLTTQGVPVSEDGSEGPEDDQVFAEEPPVQSERGYADRSLCSSGTPSPFSPVSPTHGDDGPEKQLQRRAMVLSKVLENERVYILELESLLVPLRPLKAAAYSSQPVLNSQEIQTIFHKVPELYAIHTDFYASLKERIESGQEPQTIADLFQNLVKQFGVYRAFVDNYPLAQETAEKCVQNKAQFKQIAENMCLKTSKELKEPVATTTLDVLLHKPVNHVTRVTLLIRELLNNTPREHADFCSLEAALHVSNTFLSATNQNLHPKASTRGDDLAKALILVKDGYVVQVSENTRKLRHIFLSSQLFFCVKFKKQLGRQLHLKCDWYIPLEDLSLQMQSEIQLMKLGNLQASAAHDIEEARAKLIQTKIELYLEKRQKHSIERLKKNLYDIESWLLVNAPSIPLGVQSRSGKSYLLLFSSEYELHDWTENIERLKKNSLQPFSLTPYETHSIINSFVLQHPARSLPLHSLMEETEQTVLRGILGLKIHSVSGFTKPHNIYCCFEVDCNGYFEKKAQTTVLGEDRFPKWEEEIDVHLDGAHWLRVLLWEQHDYRISTEQQDRSAGDRLLGTSQLLLDPKTLLTKEWKGLSIDLNGHQLSCAICYLHQNLSQLDELSGAPRGIFGVPISIVTYRDRSRVPLVVRHCAEDVERRGLKEVGIYRVSGIATDVQVLKAAFDSNVKDAVTKLKDNDIHVVAGTLKLYLRELPEPLLTHELIPSFVSAAAQEDPADKDKQMVSLLQQLPEANLNTFVYMMKHLKKVSLHQGVNMMSLHNLATVFGPSLLRTRHHGLPLDVSQEVVAQVQVVYYFLSGDTLSLFEREVGRGSVSAAT